MVYHSPSSHVPSVVLTELLLPLKMTTEVEEGDIRWVKLASYGFIHSIFVHRNPFVIL